jgi:hypothetical protein
MDSCGVSMCVKAAYQSIQSHPYQTCLPDHQNITLDKLGACGNTYPAMKNGTYGFFGYFWFTSEYIARG